MKNRAAGLCLLLMLSAFNWPGAEAKDAEKIAAPDIDLTLYLAPPPGNDSDQTKAEIEEILKIQKNRTPDMEAAAQADAEEVVFRFGDVLGPNFTAEKLPLTAVFYAKVHEAEGKNVDPAKDIWARPRPFLQDSRVKPCVKLSKSGSYPSGHATTGTLFGIFLARMVPDKKAEIFARARGYAHNRLVGGVHYQSDLDAGSIAGSLIAAELWRKPGFRKEFEESKRELRRVLGYAE
jgi:acid phosphatase (class A)